MKKRIGLIVISMLLLTACSIHPSTKVDGFNATKLNTGNKDFDVYLSEDTGKMKVTYKGENEYGVIIVEKEDSSQSNGKLNSNTYVLNKNNQETVACTYGNGEYTIKMCKYTGGKELELESKYSVSINLTDRLAPFRGVSYYTNYNTEIDKIIKEIKSESTQQFVDEAYKYVVANVSYDDSIAEKISSGEINVYKPKLTDVLNNKKGICLDQASLMASILRKQGIPTKIDIGHNDANQYHAWVEAYVNGRWLLYDTTLKRTYKDKETETYVVQKYY